MCMSIPLSFGLLATYPRLKNQNEISAKTIATNYPAILYMRPPFLTGLLVVLRFGYAAAKEIKFYASGFAYR
ncbi:hypothetical protein SDC9_142087 [bioreactor metagenome]|uniref:Uncharacterized protein n=1 Tax=bioreactor metagenome TaxID=1076179 RepID=A0A645E0Q2_9ZZZZ